MDGIARGSSSLLFLGEDNEHFNLFKGVAASQYSFNKGTSTQDYPSSLMGAIALLRQTYYDMQWYTSSTDRKETNISLEKWTSIQNVPQIFACRDFMEVLRADKIGDEFGIQYIFKGNGDEYRRLEAIKNTTGTIICPINFPKVYDVKDPYDALQLSLKQMKHWELAPSNPAHLAKDNIPFTITSFGLKKSTSFLKNLRLALSMAYQR